MESKWNFQFIWFYFCRFVYRSTLLLLPRAVISLVLAILCWADVYIFVQLLLMVMIMMNIPSYQHWMFAWETFETVSEWVSEWVGCLSTCSDFFAVRCALGDCCFVSAFLWLKTWKRVVLLEYFSVADEITARIVINWQCHNLTCWLHEKSFSKNICKCSVQSLPSSGSSVGVRLR